MKRLDSVEMVGGKEALEAKECCDIRNPERVGGVDIMRSFVVARARLPRRARTKYIRV
jgi:hypothetical protein